MTVVLGFMSAGFLFFGWLIFTDTVKSAFRRREALERMRTVPGVVIKLHREERTFSGERKASVFITPEIRLTAPNGKVVTFIAETGAGEWDFVVGQDIEVLYDPKGLEAPLVKRSPWEGLVMMGTGSFVFIVVGILLAWLLVAILTGDVKMGV